MSHSTIESSQWQAAAAVPEEEYRQWINRQRAAGKEITSKALQKWGRRLLRQSGRLAKPGNGKLATRREAGSGDIVTTPTRRGRESGHVRILTRPVGSIRPSPENAQLYRPVDPTDSEIVALADSIRDHGVQEPLIVTHDGWIISGHRRHAAAQLAGLSEIPCRVFPLLKDQDHDRFMQLLREGNRQRIKTYDEKLREELLSANPEEAYQSLVEYRQAQATVTVDTVTIRGSKHRAEISVAKFPFLRAIERVLEERRAFWPLSDRQIHYALLNDPPLVHARKPRSLYSNTLQGYKALVDLLTRARLDGSIPWEAIADETRPVTIWNVHADVQGFVRRELDRFLKGYWRNLMQSQPNHIEMVGEKNTIGSIIRPVAAEYCIPMTLGRGYCSLPPRYEMAKRFRNSGKAKLVLLLLTDFDPDGEEIAHSFARSLRDDFGIYQIEPVKVALTADQVEEYELPPKMKAKQTSVNYRRFVQHHGDDVFELEALAPETLQAVLREAIDGVIDVEAFNRELDAEKEDAADLGMTRQRVQAALRGMEGDA